MKLRSPGKASVTLLALALGSASARPAAAQEPAPAETQTPGAEARIESARALYLEGLKLVREAHWGEALAAFEGSQALRPHALTTFNIGACERALAHYTRARQQFASALSMNTGGELPPSTVSDAQAFVTEMDSGLLVRIRLQIEPAGAAIAIDGRPLLLAEGTHERPLLLAGILGPGRGSPAPAGELDVVVNPGLHLITLSRRGYADIVLNRTYLPGQVAHERLELARLPATIRVSSNEPNAIVTVSGKDVGPAPVDVLRPAGLYRVDVTKPGFVPYVADVRVNAGEESALRAALVREKVALTSQWWFWTAAAGLVGGVATATYLATRSEPRRPALDGGSLEWTPRIP